MQRQWQGSINLVQLAHSLVGTGEKYNILTCNYACLTMYCACRCSCSCSSSSGGAWTGLTLPQLYNQNGGGPFYLTTASFLLTL